MTNKHLISSLALFLLLVPSHTFAQVVISEIMYDLAEGSDSGREWIEVFNASGRLVDFSTWRVFEADTNHKVIEVRGGGVLESGTYAVVADKPEKFLTDNPNFNGQLFDSAFSLKNTGENIILRNADLINKDVISYLPDMGGAGDGKTLQRVNVDSTNFFSGVPTPGMGVLVSMPPESPALREAEEELIPKPAPTISNTKVAPKPEQEMQAGIEYEEYIESEQMTQVALAVNTPDEINYFWPLSAGGLILVGSIGAYFASRRGKRGDLEGWEIVEEIE